MEIVKKGPESFEITCTVCATVFRYKLAEVSGRSTSGLGGHVHCPVCGARHEHVLLLSWQL